MEQLRDINFLSIILRMLCALICGGLIGLERELKGKYAGFRTHILICIAAAMTTATSQYILLELHQYGDVARLGASVVAGLGFIGAGTIVVSQGRRIKGLTTAAGLWATGIIGLCSGAAFFEGALITTALVLFASTVVMKFERKKFSKKYDAVLLIMIRGKENLKDLLSFFRDAEADVDGLKLNEATGNRLSCMFTLRMHRDVSMEDVLSDIRNFDFVETASEIAE